MAFAKTTHVRTLIVGGGITGLSTAYALEQQKNTDYLILEAQDHVGGLCTTTFQNGYRFDFGGHLLHLHTSEGRKIVKKLLGSNLEQHKRNAFIYTNGMQVPYPFQQNLWALYPELRTLCVEELQRLPVRTTPPTNFEEWCLYSFGYGIYEAFFRPYNEKLWGCPLTELTCEWCGPFVPAPLHKEILKSASQKPAKPTGYNATFYYPKKGGIHALIDALSHQAKHIRTKAKVTHIDLTKKVVQINERDTLHFDYLVNTIPLPNFIGLLKGNIPLKKASATLRSQPITIYHLAIARSVPHFSWIYCPDRTQPFYRVGLQSGFALDALPHKNGSLFYIELPGLVPQTHSMEEHIWQGLHQKGIIAQDDIKLFSTWQTIPHAYVIFNPARTKAVPLLLSELEKHQVFCAGRYGRWEYSFMERSLVETQQLAQKLAKLV